MSNWVLKVHSDFSCYYWEKTCKNIRTCKWPLVPLTSNISVSTWPKIKCKNSFEKLRTCGFWNWPYFFNLIKIWGSYGQNTNWHVFLWTWCIALQGWPKMRKCDFWQTGISPIFLTLSEYSRGLVNMYRVSHKKCYLVLEGRSTPKFWARNKSRGCFGILRFSALKCI